MREIRMQNEKLIRKVFMGRPYELAAVETYLEEMAAKGFMFVKVKGMNYFFRKCEPIKLKFSIDVFKKASIFDTREESATLEYIEYCKEAGWQFLYSSGKIQYFCTDKEDVIPIHTDDRIKFREINILTLLQMLPSWICVIWMFFLYFSRIFRWHYINFIYEIADNTTIMNYGIMLLLGILTIVSITHYLVFLIKNLIRISQKKGVRYNTIKQVTRFNIFYVSILVLAMVLLLLNSILIGRYLFILMLSLFLIFGIIILLNYIRMGNHKLSRNFNIAAMAGIGTVALFLTYGFMFIIVMFGLFHDENSETINVQTEEGIETIYYSEDEIPLTLDDLGIATGNYDYLDSYADENKSIFAEYNSYYMMESFIDYDKNENYISYDIFKSSYQWIMERYLDSLLDEEEYHVTVMHGSDVSDWNANGVYETIAKPREGVSEEEMADYPVQRIVIYDNLVLSLDGNFTYSKLEIQKICDKLGIVKRGE
jgi:hypothetical protein